MSPTPEPVATPVAAIGKHRPEGGILGISSGNLISHNFRFPMQALWLRNVRITDTGTIPLNIES